MRVKLTAPVKVARHLQPESADVLPMVAHGLHQQKSLRAVWHEREPCPNQLRGFSVRALSQTYRSPATVALDVLLPEALAEATAIGPAESSPEPQRYRSLTLAPSAAGCAWMRRERRTSSSARSSVMNMMSSWQPVADASALSAQCMSTDARAGHGPCWG